MGKLVGVPSDRQSYQKQPCGVCLNQLALHTSLPKPLSTDKIKGMGLSSHRATFWECPACGQNYATHTIVLNLPLKEKPITQTRSYARLKCINLARNMLRTLRDTYSHISLLEAPYSQHESDTE